MNHRVGFDSQIIASRYEINYVPHNRRVQFIVHFGGQDWREVGNMALGEFLKELGVSEADCAEALKEKI